MTKFSSDLILWYKEHKRELPWRKTKDPYCIWVSEIILQQTRVNQGLMYYQQFIDAFPTVYVLARASEDQVLVCWQGLGYYSRARNMHFAAKHIVNELNGVFPDTYNDLIKLKGIGTYTAAAISSICFNEHRTVVDGNVFRVLTRIFGVETPINTSKGKKEIEELAHSLNNGEQSDVFNQAIMEFGALQCTPKLVKCEWCVFNDRCYAYLNKLVSQLPKKISKNKVQNRYLNFLFIYDSNGNTLIQRRENSDIWKGLYQFPMIETAHLTASSALLCQEEFTALMAHADVDVKSETAITHLLSHRKLFINIIKLRVSDFSVFENSGYLSVDIKELYNYALPKPLENYVSGFNNVVDEI